MFQFCLTGQNVFLCFGQKDAVVSEETTESSSDSKSDDDDESILHEKSDEEETGERSDLECSDDDLECSDDPDWASMEENTTESSEGDESEDDGQKTTRQDVRYMKHSDSKKIKIKIEVGSLSSCVIFILFIIIIQSYDLYHI